MSLTLTRRHNVDRFGYLIPTKYSNVPMVGAVATYRPGEGRYGGAVAVEEGTTNLFSHPNDLSHSSWGRQGLASVTQVEPPPGLATAWRLVEDDTNTFHRLLDIAIFEEGNTYTYSVYARGGGGRNLTIQGFGALGTPIARFDLDKGEVFYQSGAVGRIEPVGDGWYRCSMTFTMNEPTVSSSVYFGLIQGRPTQIEAPGYQGDGESYLDLSSPQKELMPFATSFVDGTRAAGRLSYPITILDPSKGTISSWVYINTSVISTLIGNGRYFFWGNTHTNEAGLIGLYWYPPEQVIRYRISQDDGVFRTVNIPLPSTGWHLFTTTWGEGVMSLYVDGQLAGSNVVDLPASFAGSGLFVGGGRGLGPLNALFDGFLVLPYEASAAEILGWYESQGPLPPHPQALLQWDWQATRPATMVAL